MNRYIADTRALDILHISYLDAMTELGSDKTITNEPLKYKHLPYVSVVLSEDQVEVLKSNEIFHELEHNPDNVLLAQNTGYEKLRSFWVKTQKRVLTGAGAKVGIMDTGSTQSVVPFEFGYNFIDNNTDVTDVNGHGTITSSIIKHPIIAVAPGCELHVLKVLTDVGGANESAVLAGIDYCIDNELDIVNLSWTYDSTATRAAIISLAAGNCVVAAASGNSSPDIQNYTLVPACLPGVVAVNSVDTNGNPGNGNVIVRTDIVGAHGISIACNGVSCQCYNKDGNYQGCWGTSCASPFFTGVFAMYKEQLGISDNKKIRDYILAKGINYGWPEYFGAGLPTF